MPTFQYQFLTKFYLGLSLVSSKIGKFKIFMNLPDKLFIFFKLNYCPKSFPVAAEFENILPRVTLERKANRWKTPKKWLFLRLVVAMATVWDTLIWSVGLLLIFTANTRSLYPKFSQIVHF